MHNMEGDECSNDFDNIDMPDGFMDRLVLQLFGFCDDAGIIGNDISSIATILMALLPMLKRKLNFTLLSFDFTGEIALSSMLQKVNHNIVTRQTTLHNRNIIKRDFSQATQLAMADSLVNLVSGDFNNQVPTLSMVDTLLPDAEFTVNHTSISTSYDDLLFINTYTKQQYEKIITDVYAEDVRISNKLNTLLEDIKSINSKFI